ncbi:MAG TPA: alpha/beta hydrolase [Candidatus Binataceae bacterium]|nr:alpha/beta hydrolase [Candidatus Binataceae bacterium]
MRAIRRRDFIAGSILAPLIGGAIPFPRPAEIFADAVAPDRGGPLIVTDPVMPPDEPCWLGPALNPDSPGGLLTRDYYLAPAALLDNPAIGMDENFGRLGSLMRSNAQLRDPNLILANAIRLRMGKAENVPGAAETQSDPKLAIAVAQLAVTGGASFEKFAQWNPKDADLIQYITQNDPALAANSSALQNGVRDVLDNAYAALWAIRANDASWRAYRAKVGWIAASGEDDLPHRPVNVPSAPFPQFDMPVKINGLTVKARYMIASAGTEFSPDAKPASPAAGSLRTIPQDRPVIPAGDQILVYLHGGGSRLEEAVPLGRQLIEAGKKRGKSYTVVSFDMLGSGYNTPFSDPELNAHPELSYHPDGDSNLPITSERVLGFPVCDSMERFIIAVIEALDANIGNVKNRIAAIMGGSLGGNMSLMLARRKKQYPYLGTIVAWSANCMMPYRYGEAYLVGHKIAGILGGDMIAKFEAPESPSSRREFFEMVYYKPLAPGLPGHPLLPPLADMWYRDGWEPCKKAFVEQTRFDRYEYYTPQYRQWIHRLDYEQALYSFQEGDVHAPNNALGPPRYLSITSRMLLAAGDHDQDWPLYTVYSSMREVAAKMANTPGTSLFMKDTGHSIHDERPIYFADRIVSFLNDRGGAN